MRRCRPPPRHLKTGVSETGREFRSQLKTRKAMCLSGVYPDITSYCTYFLGCDTERDKETMSDLHCACGMHTFSI